MLFRFQRSHELSRPIKGRDVFRKSALKVSRIQNFLRRCVKCLQNSDGTMNQNRPTVGGAKTRSTRTLNYK